MQNKILKSHAAETCAECGYVAEAFELRRTDSRPAFCPNCEIIFRSAAPSHPSSSSSDLFVRDRDDLGVDELCADDEQPDPEGEAEWAPGNPLGGDGPDHHAEEAAND